MTKIPKSIDNNQKRETDDLGILALNSRKSNYKSQKPILEKRRRDRINGSLDELKNLLLAIKQRDPLRYARLEKADILEMVVKYLKDLKKRRQAMIAAMEPHLFRSYKMGYLDCTRASIEFINEIETPTDRKKQIIDHITTECMSTLRNQCPSTNFNQHHEIVFANVNPPDHFMPYPLLSSTTFDNSNEMEWLSLEERLGFSPIGKLNFSLPDIKPLPDIIAPTTINDKDFKSSPAAVSSSLLKIVEQPERQSAFNVVINSRSTDSSLESQSTSGTAMEMPQKSIFTSDDDTTAATLDDDDDDEEEEDVGKLIIDDHNNNQTAWRPWL